MRNKPHPNQRFSYGKTYLEHRQNVELSIEEHEELMEYCEHDLDILYGTSIWDMTSTQEVVELNPSLIKIGSPCNQNWEMMNYVFKNYKGTGERDIHVSLGMISKEEREKIIDFILKSGVDFKRLVMYHCTSEYPCPFERLYLRELLVLREMLPLSVEIGFSNHGFGIAADVAAYALGVTWIERHFIDDRTFLHTDASASLEPDGFRRLCRDLKAVYHALQYKPEMSEEEVEQRRKLKVNYGD